MLSAFKRAPIRLLLLAYVVLALLYSVTTPIFEASDELWHYPMIKYMADHGIVAVPYQQPGADTAWRQEGSQPPLYYMLAAALTFWIDTSDLPALRKINPHADIGVVLPDRNVNMTIHDPAARSFPWHGAALAVMIARFLSVALGAITVWMTYQLTLELFPKRFGMALLAAAFTAFNPMFLFISSSVNNDNLSNAVAATLLVLIVRWLKRTDQPSLRELVGLGVLAGAGMLAKFNIGFLLPMLALVILLLAIRLRNARFFIVGALVTGGLTVLIAGWWYIRNWQLYGDPTGLNVFIQIVGPRAIPANGAQLWAERHTFLMSYWGFFGGVNVPLPEIAYTVFNAIATLALIGLIAMLLRWLLHWRLRRSAPIDGALWAGRALTVLWIAVLFIGLLRWTSETWASQGRLMFSAIAPISLWMAIGLTAGTALRGLPRLWATAGVIFFASISLIGLRTISAAYVIQQTPNPAMNTDADLAFYFADPGQPSALIGVLKTNDTLFPSSVTVGDDLTFCLPLKLGRDLNFSRDWSAFIHLQNNAGVIIAQRDVYLQQGLLATSLAPRLMGAGATEATWRNCFSVPLPETAYAPQRLEVILGFYDMQSGTRMAFKRGVPPDGDSMRIGEIQLVPRPSDLKVPNPLLINLGDEAELVGYTLTPNTLLVQPRQPITVTLYWRARKTIRADYRVFVQVVEPNTTHVFARDDAMPAAWTRPTSTWKVGELIEDKHTFSIDVNAKFGTWQLVVGMYQLIESPNGATRAKFQRLRIITPDGAQADDFIGLTRLKIEPPEVIF